MMELEPSDVIAIAAVVIALLSFFVTLFEVRQSRIYNRASVRPTLQITSHSGGPIAGLRIRNVGLGPAIIYETRLFLDGELLGKYNEEIVTKIANDLEKEIRCHISKTTFGNNEFVLEPNYEAFIFSIKKFDINQSDLFFKFIESRFSFVFYYRSLYGEVAKLVFGESHLRSDQLN